MLVSPLEKPVSPGKCEDKAWENVKPKPAGRFWRLGKACTAFSLWSLTAISYLPGLTVNFNSCCSCGQSMTVCHLYYVQGADDSEQTSYASEANKESRSQKNNVELLL